MTDRTCSVDSCTNAPQASGMCIKHYARNLRHGDPSLTRVPARDQALTDSQVFQAHCGEPTGDGCIEWMGTRDSYGYGRFIRGGVLYRAARFSYETARGPIPDGMVVRHSCDNPPCVNIEHLSIGTKRDNYGDARSRSRHSHGISHGNAKITDDDVREIRRMRAAGYSLGSIGKKFKMTETSISNIARRKS